MQPNRPARHDKAKRRTAQGNALFLAEALAEALPQTLAQTLAATQRLQAGDW